MLLSAEPGRPEHLSEHLSEHRPEPRPGRPEDLSEHRPGATHPGYTATAMQCITAETIWRELEGELFGFIRSRVADDATAEDLLQDVFLRIHQRLDSLADTERVVPWVYRIARNRITDHYRSQRVMYALDESRDAEMVPDAGPDGLPDALPDGRAPNPDMVLGAWLKAMISRLPENQREAIELVEIQGLSQRAAADKLGISVSGAKSRVQRGRAELRRMLHQCCEVERDRRGGVIDFEPRATRATRTCTTC